MATINGITIKSFKTFSGIEYPTIREANVWKDGHKIGTYREDEWGGASHTTKGLRESVKASALQYQKGCKDDWRKEFEGDSDSLIEHILDLAEFEKTYKANCKKGHMNTLFICNNFKVVAYAFNVKLDLSKPLHPNIMHTIEKEFPKKDYHIWQAFDETPFNIIVDENHHVPKCLER